MKIRRYDVIVVGLGHAGAEAALAAQRAGARVLAITQVRQRACLMSCNPAIGGPGKSHLVREIDALGGAMASAADASTLQARRLNRSKGPAVWATRLQVDRLRYGAAMQEKLVAAGLEIAEGEVAGLAVSHGSIEGVRLTREGLVRAPAVVLTTGTFLSARMHVGAEVHPGGRAGDGASDGLGADLRALGVRLGRFKTGTPPRLEGLTINWDRCEEQPSEPDVGPFSWTSSPTSFPSLPPRSTYVTRTNQATHAVVASALHLSPLTSGAVSARGPRYCPSLEQKVVGYPERSGHLVYLEPDGLETTEIYAGGLSTSLPVDVQQAVLRTIPGLESVQIRRPGYAVEYDYLLSGQLLPNLQISSVAGLFTAGQLNGSSGYEEAAGQGLVAGINAARFVLGGAPWIPRRAQSYLGVLCDDLVRKGFDEPYRLLPGRAENRLSLREGNAALRFAADEETRSLMPAPLAAEAATLRSEVQTARARLSDGDVAWLRAPSRRLLDLSDSSSRLFGGLSPGAASELLLSVRYEPYEEQRAAALARLAPLLDIVFPEDLAPERMVGVSAEARSALSESRPRTLRKAASLPGVSSDAVAILASQLRRRLRDVPRETSP